MNSLLRLLAVAALAATASLVPAVDKKPAAPADDGFKPMFNGKNLDGWVNVNCAPDTFFVKGEEIITTGKPTGFLRTDRQYETFVLEMDWMHVNTKEVGNSGLFVWGDPLPGVGTPYTRGIEVQVLVNLEYRDKKSNAITATSHGDLFSIHGAKCTPDRPHPLGWERCLPSENRAKGGGEWNHYKVTANDGVIKLEVNGKEVSGVSKCNPRKGYLALESEGAECHFKNIKIKELKSTDPKPEEIAKVSEGHTSLFNGIDLTGWKTEKDAWMVSGGVLKSTGKAILASERKFGGGELVFDWKLSAKSEEEIFASYGTAGVNIFADKRVRVLIPSEGGVEASKAVEVKGLKAGAWNRTVLAFDGKIATARINGEVVAKAEVAKSQPTDHVLFHPSNGVEIMNVFVRELKEKK